MSVVAFEPVPTGEAPAEARDQPQLYVPLTAKLRRNSSTFARFTPYGTGNGDKKASLTLPMSKIVRYLIALTRRRLKSSYNLTAVSRTGT